MEDVNMNKLKEGAVYLDCLGEALLIVETRGEYNAISLDSTTVPYGSTVLKANLSARRAYSQLRITEKVADSLVEYYEVLDRKIVDVEQETDIEWDEIEDGQLRLSNLSRATYRVVEKANGKFNAICVEPKGCSVDCGEMLYDVDVTSSRIRDDLSRRIRGRACIR